MERKTTIEVPKIYKQDYQIRMLRENHIPGLLGIQGRGVDGKTCFDYEVSGKVSMMAMYEKGRLSAEDLTTFLNNLISLVDDIEKFLLDIHCILLEPEYIFYEEGRFYFCYQPYAEQDVWAVFQKLADYFVRQADYKDQVCIQMVFTLHKGVMEENYSLEKLMDKCIQATKELNYEEWKKEKDATHQNTEYDTLEHDWITEQELGGAIMEETENLWTPVKRFLNRHKKPKWGDWDGLFIEEEEL